MHDSWILDRGRLLLLLRSACVWWFSDYDFLLIKVEPTANCFIEIGLACLLLVLGCAQAQDSSMLMCLMWRVGGCHRINCFLAWIDQYVLFILWIYKMYCLLMLMVTWWWNLLYVQGVAILAEFTYVLAQRPQVRVIVLFLYRFHRRLLEFLISILQARGSQGHYRPLEHFLLQIHIWRHVVIRLLIQIREYCLQFRGRISSRSYRMLNLACFDGLSSFDLCHDGSFICRWITLFLLRVPWIEMVYSLIHDLLLVLVILQELLFKLLDLLRRLAGKRWLRHPLVDDIIHLVFVLNLVQQLLVLKVFHAEFYLLIQCLDLLGQVVGFGRINVLIPHLTGGSLNIFQYGSELASSRRLLDQNLASRIFIG